MRDTERIPVILAALEAKWRKHPDQRLCQLIVNLNRPKDIFYVEDDQLLELLRPHPKTEIPKSLTDIDSEAETERMRESINRDSHDRAAFHAQLDDLIERLKSHKD